MPVSPSTLIPSKISEATCSGMELQELLSPSLSALSFSIF
jgi:hypothetical protein